MQQDFLRQVWRSWRGQTIMERVVPQRLNETKMLRFLEDGFAIAHAVMPEGRPFNEVARGAGYRPAMAANMTPLLRLATTSRGRTGETASDAVVTPIPFDEACDAFDNGSVRFVADGINQFGDVG